MSRADQSVDGDGQARIVEINGKRYMTGLLWQPLYSVSTSKKEVSKFAKEQGMNLSIIHTGLALQAGFASVEDNRLKEYLGSWSMVSVLASKLGESWLGVFDLDDGNAVISAVHDGKIVPGCDVVGSHEEISTLASEVLHLYPWGSVYCTGTKFFRGAQVDNITIRSLKEILTDKRVAREHKVISPFENNNGLILAVLGTLLILGAAWYGWGMWKEAISRKAAEAQDMISRATKDEKKIGEKKKAQAEVDAVTIKPDWVSRPKAGDFIKACEQSFKKVPLVIGGWKLKDASCTDTSLSMNYGRVVGMTMLDFKDSATELKKRGVINSFSSLPDLGKASIKMPTLEPRAEEELIYPDEFTIPWVSFFQSISGATSELKERPHPKPPTPKPWIKEALGDKKSTPQPPWWETYTWSFSSSVFNGFDLLRVVPKLPGFVVKKISLTITEAAGNATTWKWSADGEVHVKK